MDLFCTFGYMKISLDLRLETGGDLRELQKEILEKLTEEQLFAEKKPELCFHVLSLFDFPEGGLRVDKIELLEAACDEVLKIIGADPESMEEIWGKRDKDRDPMGELMLHLLGYKYPPGAMYEYLDTLVNKDLEECNDYIAKYETEDFIRKGETPRNHKDGTRKAFYDRCIRERDQIQVYLTEGMRDRAIEKAMGLDLGSMSIFEGFKDRPYRTPYPDSKRYFDDQAIDKVAHRTWELTLREAIELKPKYKADKKAFYAELDSKIPIADSLASLISYANYIPLIHPQRKVIFPELKKLFEQQEWFGFYALCLTQIEGVFGDMSLMCDPERKTSGALPDKVKFVKNYYPHNEIGLDYFAFELPNRRNAFLHSGIESSGEEMELLCKDTLLDLVEALRIFNSLDTDANWLHRLMNKVDEEFHSIRNFCFYFDLVSGITEKDQLKYFDGRINHFRESLLPSLLFDVAFTIDERFESAWKKLRDALFYNTQEEPFCLDIDTVTKKDIYTRVASIKNKANAVVTWMDNEMEELLHMKSFIEKYEQYVNITNLDELVLVTFNKFKADHFEKLDKLSHIAEIIDFKIQGK
jgi:hypothetical protein